MLGSALRASRRSLLSVARQPYGVSVRRTLITPTAIRQADLVQDMYLRELKSYKPTAVKASDAEGHVQTFAIPKAPPSPEESEIAKDLNAYETQAVEIEGQASQTPGGAAPVEEDWFEEDEDEAPAAAH